MKAHRGSRGIAPLILNLGTRERRGVNSTPRPGHFTPRKKARYPLNRRLSEPQSQFGHYGEEKDILSLPSFEPQTIQPIALLLYRLCYRSSYHSQYGLQSVSSFCKSSPLSFSSFCAIFFICFSHLYWALHKNFPPFFSSIIFVQLTVK
jgi:hypothetical protein